MSEGACDHVLAFMSQGQFNGWLVRSPLPSLPVEGLQRFRFCPECGERLQPDH